MRQCLRIDALREALRPARRAGRSIGLVPTMGYLHDGHLELIRRARAECDETVVSIFVNPLQFGPGEDFERYPRDFARDAALANAAGADLLFAPPVAELYPAPPLVQVSVPELSRRLEGSVRPHHFQGVATVVAKLFNIVQPDRAYFGQKDAQQVAVVRRLARDLDFPVEIRVVPTVREPDGLAMSSRNVYLTPEQRPSALRLYGALVAGRRAIAQGERSADAVRAALRAVLSADPQVAVDYAEVADPDDLQPLSRCDGPVLLLVAARVGSVRLIDNLPAGPDAPED